MLMTCCLFDDRRKRRRTTKVASSVSGCRDLSHMKQAEFSLILRAVSFWFKWRRCGWSGQPDKVGTVRPARGGKPPEQFTHAHFQGGSTACRSFRVPRCRHRICAHTVCLPDQSAAGRALKLRSRRQTLSAHRASARSAMRASSTP